MNTQDRAVVKSLLQYMTDKFLTGGDEFRAALKHFNITTTSYQPYEGFTKTKHVVMVFAADRIDRCPHGFRVEFASKEEAEAYEAKMRATGDELTAEDIDALHAEAMDMNAEVDLVRWDAAMTAERAMDDACRVADAAHAEALEMNVGIELAKHIMAAMKDSDDAADAARGCLARDGFNEINFIIHAALMARAEVLKAHAEALEMNQARSETIRAIIAQVIHAGANSFGGVIGEHEELVETLRNAGYLTAAHKVDAVYDTLDASNHKAVRKSWLAALRDVSAAL